MLFILSIYNGMLLQRALYSFQVPHHLNTGPGKKILIHTIMQHIMGILLEVHQPHIIIMTINFLMITMITVMPIVMDTDTGPDMMVTMEITETMEDMSMAMKETMTDVVMMVEIVVAEMEEEMVEEMVEEMGVEVIEIQNK